MTTEKQRRSRSSTGAPSGAAVGAAPANDSALPGASPAPSKLQTETDNPHPDANVHECQQNSSSLLDDLAEFAGSALRGGEGAIVIARKSLRTGLEQHLLELGLDPSAVRGRYLSLDADDVMSAFMREGRPDASRFTEVMGRLIERARAKVLSDPARVAVFSEMASLLWEQEHRDAAIQVEQLWNELAEKHSFYLRCSAPARSSDPSGRAGGFLMIWSEHSGASAAGSAPPSRAEGERPREVSQFSQRVQAFDHETALRQAEERFHLVVENIQDYAIFMLDAAGCVVSWNRGAERMKGYTASEIIGQHFSIFYTREDIAADKPTRMLRTAATEGLVRDEGWRVRKDGSRFWASLVITARSDEAGNLVGFAKITRDATDQKAHEESLRRLTGQLMSLQDDERRRIARDLHDGTAQALAALSINLSLLQMHEGVKRDPQLAKIAAESEALAKQAADEVRNVSHLLHPPDLDAVGLEAAIRWYATRFTARNGISISIDAPSSLNRMDQDLEIGLFRIVQEGLANIQRHSGSPSAEIRLMQRNDDVILEVRDQGCGIPPRLLGNDEYRVVHPGIGITGMKERMRQLGGRLEVLSNSAGTTLRAVASVTRKS
ncbi:MAG: PAS domain S-box protein [Terriglobia bacterium]